MPSDDLKLQILCQRTKHAYIDALTFHLDGAQKSGRGKVNLIEVVDENCDEDDKKFLQSKFRKLDRRLIEAKVIKDKNILKKKYFSSSKIPKFIKNRVFAEEMINRMGESLK